MQRKKAIKNLIMTILILGLITPVTVIANSSNIEKVRLKSPSNGSELDSIPVLEWYAASGAEGYNWEVATSPDIDSTGYFFVDLVYYGSTGKTYGQPKNLQKNVWYYWHAWGVAGGEPGPLSDTWRFKIVDDVTEDTIPPSVPRLISPKNDATLPNQPIRWEFVWSNSTDSESGVKGYHIYVIGPQAKVPLVDTFVTESQYSFISDGYVAEHNLEGWTWRVRAQDNAGNWSEWGATWTFDVKYSTVNWAPPWQSEPEIQYGEFEVIIEQRFMWSQEALENLKRKLHPGTFVAFQWDLKRFIPRTSDPADVWDYWIVKDGMCQGTFETDLPSPWDFFTEEADPPRCLNNPLLHPEDEEFQFSCYAVDSLKANKWYFIRVTFRKKESIQFDRIDIETKFERIEYGPKLKLECIGLIDCIDCLKKAGFCSVDKLIGCASDFRQCMVTYTYTDPYRVEGIFATGESHAPDETPGESHAPDETPGESHAPDETPGECIGSILLALMITLGVSAAHMKRD